MNADCQLPMLIAFVSNRLGEDVTPRTFSRWRALLGLAKGRGAFYTAEEAMVLVEFGSLVKQGMPYADAHQLIYQKYRESTEDGNQEA